MVSAIRSNCWTQDDVTIRSVFLRHFSPRCFCRIARRPFCRIPPCSIPRCFCRIARRPLCRIPPCSIPRCFCRIARRPLCRIPRCCSRRRRPTFDFSSVYCRRPAGRRAHQIYDLRAHQIDDPTRVPRRHVVAVVGPRLLDRAGRRRVVFGIYVRLAIRHRYMSKPRYYFAARRDDNGDWTPSAKTALYAFLVTLSLTLLRISNGEAVQLRLNRRWWRPTHSEPFGRSPGPFLSDSF